jgi:hypothetical protein
MLKVLLNDYIIGDKGFPHYSPHSVHLWNAVKAQEPNHYKEWNILNINGDQIGHLNLVDDQQEQDKIYQVARTEEKPQQGR